MDGILTVEGFDTSLAEGVMLLTPFNADATDEATVAFVTEYQNRYDETPNQFAADGYDCIYALKQALETAGCTPDMSAQEINDALIEVFPTITFTGLTGDGEGITWGLHRCRVQGPQGHDHPGRRPMWVWTEVQFQRTCQFRKFPVPGAAAAAPGGIPLPPCK